MAASAAAWPHANYSTSTRRRSRSAELAKILKNYPTASTKITVNQTVAQSFATLPTRRPRLARGRLSSGWARRATWKPRCRSIGLELALVATLSLRSNHSAFSVDDLVVALVRPIDARPLLSVPWTRALDLDRSPSAVVLDLVMTRAMDALPHLIYEAVTGRPCAFRAVWGPDPFDRRHGILG